MASSTEETLMFLAFSKDMINLLSSNLYLCRKRREINTYSMKGYCIIYFFIAFIRRLDLFWKAHLLYILLLGKW